MSPKLRFRLRTSNERPRCQMLNNEEVQGKRWSDKIDVDKDLCLSVRLEMVRSGELSSLINYSLTVNTFIHVLYYYYLSEEKELSDERDISNLNIKEFLQGDPITHVVTRTKSGVLVVVVLQMSSGHEFYLNPVLKKINKQLCENFYDINDNDKRLFSQFTSMKVFSNIPSIAQMTNLNEIYQKITQIKTQASEHRLLEYTLRPIAPLVSPTFAEKCTYSPLYLETINTIEQHLIELSHITEPLKTLLSSEVKQLLEDVFKQHFNKVEQQISNTIEKKKSRFRHIRDLVYQMRSGASQEQTIAEMQIEEYENVLHEEVVASINRFLTLQDKLHFIEGCKKNEIVYCNVKTIVKDNDYDLETITKQLWIKDKQQCVFCFDDKLASLSSTRWYEFYTKLINDCRDHPELEFVYADFSYCSYRLIQMDILTSKDNNKPQKIIREETTSRTATSSTKNTHADESSSPSNKIINILLLGTTGVGKSTFVNAIVNYLNFENFSDACSGQPIVLMPVSFLKTVGDDFEEKTVRFGAEDPNEDHQHPGQSVTQRCRSYIFAVGTQTKIRLIDTPGMGDTRGLAQDNLYMQHILSFINNLPHLNAICILLQPNEADLNVVFRSYFTRLLGFLGEKVRDNIVFCFTDTRATFFAPGNTGPLLRKMLDSHSIKGIPFKKTNTFCFDNESFRYLVARLNGIEFDDYQKEEYNRSWNISVKESNRLLVYICTKLEPYLQEEWQSVEHAQSQLTQLIRPMLETTRNMLRNIILQKEKSSKPPIKLIPRKLSRPSTVCTACNPTLQCYSDFWVLPDVLHIISDKCDKCKCSGRKHVNVDYKLEYENPNDTKRQSYDELISSLDQLKEMIVNLASFFTYLFPHSESEDPIMYTLSRMIAEENQACSLKGTQCFNPKLCEELDRFKEKYRKKRNTSVSNENPTNLPIIYELIKNISEIDSIMDQMDAIQLFRQESMR